MGHTFKFETRSKLPNTMKKTIIILCMLFILALPIVLSGPPPFQTSFNLTIDEWYWEDRIFGDVFDGTSGINTTLWSNTNDNR